MSELPEHWAVAPLKDLVSKLVDGSHNPPPKKPHGLPMLSAINIANNNIEMSTFRLIDPDAFALEDQRTRIAPGDVLLTIVGAIGRTAIVPQNVAPFTLQRSVAVLSPILVDSKFLMYQLEAPRLARYLVDNARGTAQKGVYLKTLGQMQIWIPPLEEQRRIVAKIEELFSELDKGVESLTIARAQLKAYRQSVLNRAVVGEMAGSPTFSIKPLSAIVSDLGQGWSPRCLNHPAADDDTWAVITTTAIQHGVFQQKENKQLPEELKPRPHLAIKAGDILITRAGPRKRVGVACLVRHCRPRLMLCDKAYRLRVNTDEVFPEWLELILNSPSILQEIEELKTGISDSGVNLTQNRFLELQVPVPDLTEQRAVLAEVDSLTSQMTNLEVQIETAMHQSDTLRQSILKRAFSGQLVAHDAADETAFDLLERIRAELKGNSATNRPKIKKGKQEAA